MAIAISSARNYSLDLARGLCLILMAVDHLPNNVVARFSNYHYSPFGFFTAASAFVFISGIVSAKAYGSTYLKKGAAEAWRRVLRRCGQLYAVNTGILLLLFAGVATGVLAGEHWRHELPLFFNDPGRGLVMGLLMLYRPGFLDILPMYVLFLLCIVPVMAARRAGLLWLVLAVSAALWGWAQFNEPEFASLNACGFQVLFLAGLLIGSSSGVEEALQRPSWRTIGRVALAIALGFAAARLAMAALQIMEPAIPNWSLLTHTDNNGVLRVLSFAAFVLATIYVWPLVPAWIKTNNPVASWVRYLGQHSLPVFAWSIVATYLSLFLMPPEPSKLWRVADMLLTVSSLAIPALMDAWLKRGKKSGAVAASAIVPPSDDLAAAAPVVADAAAFNTMPLAPAPGKEP